MVLGKKDITEEILRVDKLDRSTCEALKGVMDEEGKCIIRIHSNPDDPDTIVIRAIRYRHRGVPPTE